jgi:hypothetical protein
MEVSILFSNVYSFTKAALLSKARLELLLKSNGINASTCGKWANGRPFRFNSGSILEKSTLLPLPHASFCQKEGGIANLQGRSRECSGSPVRARG